MAQDDVRFHGQSPEPQAAEAAAAPDIRPAGEPGFAPGGNGEGMAEQAAAAEGGTAGAAGDPQSHQFPPPPPCPNGFIYTVQPGDTLFFIAQRFGVTLQALIAANPQIPDPSAIVPGQRICVPTGVIVPPPPPCPNGFIYTVQPGDTLFFIAQRFGVTLQALIAANPQIPDPSAIVPGQQICVPTGVLPPPPPACRGGFVYKVQPGDTLFFIAQRFGVTLQALIAANPQIPNPNILVPGQLICVPTIPPAPPPPPPPCPNGVLYMVAPGDTLFLIAQTFGVTLQALLQANPQIVNPSLIFPGQLICVPTSPGPVVPTVECCMLLFRTANVPRGAEAGGVARIFQSAAVGANVLVGTIDLPPPSTFGGATFVAWLRGVAPDGRTVKIPLVRTNPLLTPRVWTGSLAVPPGRQVAPFNDLIVTAEISPDVMQPNLSRIVLIGLFAQCQPQSLTTAANATGGAGPTGGTGGSGGSGGSGCCG